MSFYDTLTTEISGMLDGCVLRIGNGTEVYFVESCRALENSEKLVLVLSGLSGVAIEYLVDIKDVSVIPVEKVNKKIFFTYRELCPLCCNPTAK
jgi:hypothetical protein